ncbi:hypothetical protein [Pseudomonas helleri]|uniref:hypothetical protein n=1 Tax=Pseudomonas helleri TaxID=1608996 RepID=UPI003FD63DF3
MDLHTQQEISNMVEAIHDMATKEFAEFKSTEPFETHVCSGDDLPERARIIGEGLRLGLHEYYRSERVIVRVVDTGYLVQILRP